MRTFLSTIKNNYLRTLPRLFPLMLYTIFTLSSMLLAVHMTEVRQVKGHIVLITENPYETLPKSTDSLSIVVSKEKPPLSALVKQKYDAYVTIDEKGDYQIETLRNKEYQQMVQMFLNNPKAPVDTGKTDRGVGTNIIGFMMMFLLMLAFINLFAFAEDKEQGQLKRIAAAPVSFPGYLLAHCVYCLSMVLPEFTLLVLLKVSGFKIGFTLLEYAGLLAVLSLLSISFAMFLNTLIKKPDNANMLGNSIVVLTSVLAGSFYVFSKNNSILDRIIKLLPQKQLMNFAHYLEQGTPWQHSASLVYVISFSVVLMIFSGVVLRFKYVK
jgi:ABC-2 type transport system permease protein